MNTDPRLYRRLLLRAPAEGRVQILTKEFGVSPATIYRLIKKAISDGAIVRLGECAYSAGPQYHVFVDHIDTAYGGFSDSHLLAQPGLPTENHVPATRLRLAPGWVNTGAQCTYVILPPVPPDLATRLLHFGRSWRYSAPSDHGTAQFYVGKNGASVVLHLRNRPYPDGMEDHVPRFQRAEAKAWAQELVNAFPGLRLIDRPIWHPDPKAQESRTPLPSGELVKRILGVDEVARERVGPATETNNSPPGPSLETAGIEEARQVAQAPFVLDALRKEQSEIRASLTQLADAYREQTETLKAIRDALAPKPEPAPALPAIKDEDRMAYG